MSQVRQSSRPAFRGRVRWIFLVCIALYAVAGIGCASFQHKLIYYPPVLTSEQVDKLARAANVERWMSASSERIGLKRFSPRQPAEGQLLMLYGNSGCAVACAHYADVIQQAVSLDVFIVEYPGYADRRGSPSQSSLFRAADEALRSLATNRPIFLLGESLGTGVAVYLAGRYPDNIAGESFNLRIGCSVAISVVLKFPFSAWLPPGLAHAGPGREPSGLASRCR